MENKKWILFCIIGGALMILSSVVGGLGFLGRVLAFISKYIGTEGQQILTIILTILGYIAMGGGISVIVGAIIITKDHYKSGRMIIGLGIGASLISLIIMIIINLMAGATIKELPEILLSVFNGAYGLAGVLLAIISRMKLKKDK